MVSFKGIDNFKPYLGQIIVQISFAGMYIIARVAFIDGMSRFVFVTYRQVIATLAIAPFAYLFERKGHPPFTWITLFQIFLLASGNTIAQYCYYQGLYYTSSTFGSAALNLVPILTLAMATILRLEKVNIRSLGGKAKVVGTVICVTGAMVMTLYKGPAIKFLSHGIKSHLITLDSKTDNLVLGSIMVFGSIVIWSAWVCYQAHVLKTYPVQLSLTTLMCLIGGLESGLIAVICEHKKSNVWVIGWNIRLLSVLYTGIICSAFGVFLQVWCISKKGPVFVTIFNPVGTIVTAILEFIVLHVCIRVGSAVGAVLIALGLYSVLWGKAHDISTEDVKESNINVTGDFEKGRYPV
jgi:drug/metabolite transporter (DMT)-like permease